MAARKPSYHLSSPKGWINDPCAPSFDKETGIYHVFYQWVKDGTEWSHAIGWGHATSTDLMHWQHDDEPSLWPGESYDSQGVFTGCELPSQLEKAVIYTSVDDKGPGAPYVWGQEGLVIARSTDGGKTWVKDAENPVKAEPPANITGWRDPLVSSWPSVDRASNRSSPHTYALLSGGIEGQGPTFFIYELSLASPHTKWQYLGMLIEPEARPARPETKWTGDRGWNWECGGFFELDGASYIIFSSEGDWFEPFDGKTHGKEAKARPPKWQLWFRGRIEAGPKFVIEQEGVLDWGCYYAAQSFEETSGGRRIFHGWNADDDLSPAVRAKQGWTGVFSLPREFFTQRLTGVTKALQSSLDSLPSFRCTPSETKGEYNIETLGFRPVPEANVARRNSHKLPAVNILQNTFIDLAKSRSCELKLKAEIKDGCEAFSVTVLDNVVITFWPQHEMITIDKSHSTDEPTTNVVMAQGAHTLFTTSEGQETFDLRIFIDDSLIEVYANERFALSTRVYAEASRSNISISSKGEGGAVVQEIECWEMGLK